MQCFVHDHTVRVLQQQTVSVYVQRLNSYVKLTHPVMPKSNDHDSVLLSHDGLVDVPARFQCGQKLETQNIISADGDLAAFEGGTTYI